MTAQYPNSYQSNFDPSKGYVEPLFFPGTGLAAYEKNDTFKMLDYKIKEVSKLITKDGDIVDGASPVVNKTTGAVRIPAGKIVIRNEILAYPEASFTIAVNKTVKLGVYLEEFIISGGEDTENFEDPDLLDPSAEIDGKIYATSGRETSKRLQYVITWGWKDEDDNASQDSGVFYETFSVENGILVLPTTVTSKSGIIEEIANYDRDVNGNYLVEGLDVSFDYQDGNTDGYVLNIAPGKANINGYKRQITANTQFELAFDPDLRQVDGDPAIIGVGNISYSETITRGGTAGGSDTLGRDEVVSVESVVSEDGETVYTVTTDYTVSGNVISWAPGGAEPSAGTDYVVNYIFTGAVVTTDKYPIDNVISVLAPLEITDETVVRGAIAGGIDPLDHNSVIEILEVKQGLTTFVEDTDYTLTGSNIDWSLGGAEPAPSSSYTVSYRYNKAIAADEGSINNDIFTITNQGADGDLVDGSTVFTAYEYRLPRIDLLEFTQSGQLRRVKGVAQDGRPNEPKSSPDAIGLVAASIDWINDPKLKKLGNLAIKQGDLQQMKNKEYALGVLIAELSLKLDAVLSGASNAGIFVDSFTDTDKTDSGREQTLAIVDNTLTVPLTITRGDLVDGNNNTFVTLDPTDVVMIEQNQSTASIKINPFATFTVPTPISVDNPIDHQVDDTSDQAIIGAINSDPNVIIIDPRVPVVIDGPDGTISDPQPPTVPERVQLTLTGLRDLIKDAKGVNKLQPSGRQKTLTITTKLNSGEDLGVVKVGGVSIDTATGEVVKVKKK